MGNLDNTWNLEHQLKNMSCSGELKREINKFIQKHHDKCTGKRMSYTNLFYRSSLHYIIDNINNPNLLNELKIHNNS